MGIKNTKYIKYDTFPPPYEDSPPPYEESYEEPYKSKCEEICYKSKDNKIYY